MQEKIGEIAEQAKERGGLLTAISAGSALMGVVCLGVGCIVGYKALVDNAVPIQQPAAMLAAGLLLLVATHSMWKYERWGRNMAVFVTICLGWVMTEAINRRFGTGVGTKIPVVLFGAMAASYFTSARGRHMFRKRDEKDSDEVVG